MIWDINKSPNSNYNKIRENERALIQNQMSESAVAKIEYKPKPDILFETRHSF